jgi:predicted O-methyltransferase YrrM
MTTNTSAAYARMADLAIGVRVAIALRMAAELGIADHLAEGPKSVAALAGNTGLPAESLRRLLRGLSAFGVFEESADGMFSQTEMSACMRRRASPSLREMILVLNEDAVLNGWRRLPHVLESGAPAFPAANGESFFDYIASDEGRSALMGEFMTGIYGSEGAKIATSIPFTRYDSLLDVGGGQGHVLIDILQQNPRIRGALFDLPQTAEIARSFLTDKGFSHCEVLAGDFFENIPSGFDAYFIKSVLHDWDDDSSTRILSNCRKAMSEHGRVLVADVVIQPGNPVQHPHRMIDLEMMVSFGGKERTAEDFQKLLTQVGLKLEQITPVNDSFLSVVEASRAA